MGLASAATNLMYSRRALNLSSRDSFTGSFRCAQPSVRALSDDDVNVAGPRDPQLDPERHRRRPVPARGPIPCLLPAAQDTQQPRPPSQSSLLWPLLRRPCREEGQIPSADGNGLPSDWRSARDRNARGPAGGLVSSPGVPNPGTVQDQSSCALLLPRHARGASSPAEADGRPSSLPFGAIADVELSGAVGSTKAGGCDCRENHNDRAGVRECSGGLSVGTSRVTLAASALDDASVSLQRLGPTQHQHQDVAVPSWGDHAWVPPYGSDASRTAISWPPASGCGRESCSESTSVSPAAIRRVTATAYAGPGAEAVAGCPGKVVREGFTASGNAAEGPRAWGTRRRRYPLRSTWGCDNEDKAHAAGCVAEGVPRPDAVSSAMGATEAFRNAPPPGKAAVAVHASTRPSTWSAPAPGTAAESSHHHHGCHTTPFALIAAMPCETGGGSMCASNGGNSGNNGTPHVPELLHSPSRALVAGTSKAKAAARVPGNSGSGCAKHGSLARGRNSSREVSRSHGVCNMRDADGRPHAGGVAGRRLMRAVTSCRHWQQLRAVLHEYAQDVNVLHVTAALGKLSRMQLPPPPPTSQPVSGSQHGRMSRPVPPPQPFAPTGESLVLQSLLSDLEVVLGRHLDAAHLAGANRSADTARSNAHGTQRSSAGCSNSSSPDSTYTSSKNCNTGGSSNAACTSPAACKASATTATTGAVCTARPCLGPRQLATCLAALARLRADGWHVADPVLLGAAVTVSGSWELERVPSQELTTLLYSFAKLEHHPGSAWLEAGCGAAAAAAAGRRMCPRQLSTFLWALAKLRHQPSEAFMTAWIRGAVRAMARFSAYDISQALWALATLHRARRLPHPAMATATALELPPPLTAWGPPHGLPEVFVRAALGQAKAMLRPAGGGGGGWVPQDVCNVLWAVSQLQLGPPRGWVAAVAAALLSASDVAIARCRAADLAGLLWALARLLPDAPPPRGEMLRIVAATARLAPQCGEQDLANLLWALGTLRFVPPPLVMHAFGCRLLALCVRGAARPQLLSTALWCCVRLRVPPRPALLRQVLAAAARNAPEFGPRSAPLLLYSLARLHHLGWLHPGACPGRSQPLRAPPQLHLQAQPQHVSPEATAVAWPAVPAVADWQNERRGEQRVDASADGADLGESAAAPATSPPLLPPLDLGPFLDSALRGMTDAELQGEGGRPRLALPVLLWSVVRLGYRPDEGWTRAYLAHSFEVLPQLSPAEAGLVASSLLRLGALPPPLWLARMEHLMTARWGPEADREAAQLRRELRTLTRRAAATATAAPITPSVPEFCPEHPGPPVARDALSGAQVNGASRGAATFAVQYGNELWRQRQSERRREVAARVLAERREGVLRRLALLRGSVARLRWSLTRLRARVWQSQYLEAKQQSHPLAAEQ